MKRCFPLARTPILCRDDQANYNEINQLGQVVIPLSDHPGSFGYVRKNHIHEGVDLYGNKGEEVFAIESGDVSGIFPFTGSHMGMPWWNDTWAMSIEDGTGIWVYGEIEPYWNLFGTHVKAGQPIGRLLTVLKHDKGRPMTMLHLERRKHGFASLSFEWLLNEPQPDFLLDPTEHLTNSL